MEQITRNNSTPVNIILLKQNIKEINIYLPAHWMSSTTAARASAKIGFWKKDVAVKDKNVKSLKKKTTTNRKAVAARAASDH